MFNKNTIQFFTAASVSSEILENSFCNKYLHDIMVKWTLTSNFFSELKCALKV
jgi:hypothetical protein